MSWIKEDGTLHVRKRSTFRVFKESRNGREFFHLQILNQDGKVIRRMECSLDFPDDMAGEMRLLVERTLESGARKAALEWIEKRFR